MDETETQLTASYFTPETMMPSQWCDLHRSAELSPEKQLMLAVFEDAWNCILGRPHGLGYGVPDKVSYRRKQLHDEAVEWFSQTEATGYFGFVDLCQALGFDPDAMRAKALAHLPIHLPRRNVRSDDARRVTVSA